MEFTPPYTPPFNLHRFIAENEALLQTPPTNVKALWRDADFIVFLVGGPNQRRDYHIDPCEEFFYQLRGRMCLNVMAAQGPARIPIEEGCVYLLPPNLPHSPQRPQAGSLGLVVERVRASEEFAWYCENCHQLLHRVRVSVKDIEKDLPPVFANFHARADLRTCSGCNTLHPGK